MSSLREACFTGQLMPQEEQLPPQPWHPLLLFLRRFTMEMTANTAAARMIAASTSVTASPAPVRDARIVFAAPPSENIPPDNSFRMVCSLNDEKPHLIDDEGHDPGYEEGEEERETRPAPAF